MTVSRPHLLTLHLFAACFLLLPYPLRSGSWPLGRNFAWSGAATHDAPLAAAVTAVLQRRPAQGPHPNTAVRETAH